MDRIRKEEPQQNLLFDRKALLRLMFPLIVEQFLTVAVGMADSIMIASVGEAAVSGVSLVDSINILIINLFAALATGGAVVCGQLLGKQKPDKACKAAGQLLLFTTAVSLVIMAGVYIAKELILRKVFGQLEPDVFHHAHTYLVIVTASIPFIAIFNACAAIFRTMGNSKITMLISLLMNSINITGNAILIYGLHMGVAGAAIPTLVSRIIAALTIFLLLRNPSLPVHLDRKIELHTQPNYISKILYIGVPNGLENSLFQLGKIMVLNLVATFGTTSIAANAVTNTFVTFQVLPGMAIGMETVTVVSRCVGASDFRQARYYTRRLLATTYLCLLAVNAVLFAALPTLLGLYHLSDETARIARQLITLHGTCCMMIWPLSFMLPNTLRAANDVRYCMAVSILSMIIMRVGFSYILGRHMGLGVLGVWLAMLLDWMVRSLCFGLRYHSKKWQRVIL